ncbi:CsgG/HfaB family protein [Thermospira aquatica]|uniref:DUF3575 domain-containing protein n=1 Tax=Thermospira aquatica TaxID=2828656 RepID=A0AAX3BDA2_9SPIR|nr:CsgG/HfaB family protein [Thermospira aquatica]URA10292.1 hypothetical protein KDW03_00360 [Thermospira aquatica]
MRLWRQVLLLLGLFSIGFTQETLSIVVMEIENRTSETSLDNRTLTEVVELHVVNMRQFRVVERQKLDRILSEQKLNASGLTEKEVARVGSLVGASKAITGSLSRVGSRYILILRLIDTTSATIEEVSELKDTSLERLLDRIDEPVKDLVRSLGAKKPQKISSSSPSQAEKTSTSAEVETPSRPKDSGVEETDEEALERLIRNAKEKLKKQDTNQSPSPQEASLPPSQEPSTPAPEVKEEASTLLENFRQNPWGIILQLGITGDAQIYNKKWNFAGVGWGLFTLENRIYIGYEFAFIRPSAHVMMGYQIGGFPEVKRYLLGVQHGFINTVEISALGWQAGFINTTRDQMLGFQQGFLNTTGTIRGVQLGFVNTAKEVRGIQMGFLNVTGRLYGIQLGLLNTSRQNGLPFMIGINIGF